MSGYFGMMHFAVHEQSVKYARLSHRVTLFEYEKDAVAHAKMCVLSCEYCDVLSLQDSSFTGKTIWRSTTPRKRIVKMRKEF